ncbi:hypothetical protein [Mesorhizobium shangrilense]|uniref:Uncharacterized protein n=1 Tax=Mesorhizobium shangrilense TaxID=460060 RepID=A0ABV2DBT5_9HYPH
MTLAKSGENDRTALRDIPEVESQIDLENLDFKEQYCAIKLRIGAANAAFAGRFINLSGRLRRLAESVRQADASVC